MRRAGATSTVARAQKVAREERTAAPPYRGPIEGRSYSDTLNTMRPFRWRPRLIA